MQTGQIRKIDKEAGAAAALALLPLQFRLPVLYSLGLLDLGFIFRVSRERTPPIGVISILEDRLAARERI